MKKFVVTSNGRVTIPANLRRKYGMKKGTVVLIRERNGEIVIRPLTNGQIAIRKSLSEDAEDLAAFEEQAHVPDLPFEKVPKNIKGRELL